MSTLFPGLSEADFHAYLPARATSNAYVRPRLPVREKLLVLGRDLAERAQRTGLALEANASDERPSIWNKKSVTEQWVFLWRDRAERAALERAAEADRALGAALLDPTPYYQHAFLALLLDATHFEVTLRLHAGAWADVKNLRQRLDSEDGRSAITATLAAMPPGFTLGVTGGEQVPAERVDATHVGSVLAAAVAGGSWLAVSRSVSRADAIVRGAALRDDVDAAFDALVPLYRLFAWRREDDQARVADELDRGRAAKQVQLAEATARQAEWVAQHDAEIERRREQAMQEARERLAAQERARPMAVHAAVASVPVAPSEPKPARMTESRPARVHEPRPATVRAPERRPAEPARSNSPRPVAPPSAERAKPAAPPRPMRWVESDDPITLGGRVRIRSGPFAGKEGTVTELDPRGVAKISLGLISARVEATQLVTLAERPA